MNKKENITIECLNLQKGIADNNCKLTKNKKITIFYFSPENFYCKTRLFAKTLSSDEKVKAASFHFVKDSKNYIINRGILRFLLCEKTGGNSAGVQINMGINNKPFVDNTDIFFNVSHTKTLCVIALSDNCNLGVDIEMIRKNVGYKKISNSFFSDSDNEQIKKSDDPEKSFHLLWTRKEAFLKAIGLGLNTNLNQINVGSKINSVNYKQLCKFQDVEIYDNYFIYWGQITNHFISVATPLKSRIEINELHPGNFPNNTFQ